MLFLSLKTQDSRRWHWHRIVRYFRRRVVSYWHPGPTALRTLASLSLGIMMPVYRCKSLLIMMFSKIRMYVLRDDRLDDMLPGQELVKDRPWSLGVFWTRARGGWVCFSSECEWWIMMFIALTIAIACTRALHFSLLLS